MGSRPPSADLADELLQFRRARRGEHFLRHAFFMHLAVVHEDELGADVAGKSHFMPGASSRDGNDEVGASVLEAGMALDFLEGCLAPTRRKRQETNLAGLQ